MSLAFFWVPAMQPGQAEQELNAFLRSHRILTLCRQFVADGQASAWAIAVEYLAGAVPSPQTGKSKVDYREVLDPETFAVFATLRACRQELAQKDAVPAYAILTNEQMAQMARLRVSSAEDLARIEGFGEARVRKYGKQLLAAVKHARPSEDSPGAQRRHDEGGA